MNFPFVLGFLLAAIYYKVPGMLRRSKAKKTPAQPELTPPQTTVTPDLATSVSVEHTNDSNSASRSFFREQMDQAEQDTMTRRKEQTVGEYWKSENAMADLQRFLRSVDEVGNTSTPVPQLTSLVDYLLASGFLDKSLPPEWNRDAIMPAIYYLYYIDRSMDTVTVNRDAHKAWADFPRVFGVAELESAIKAGQTVGRPMNVMSHCFREQTYFGIRSMSRYMFAMKESKEHISLQTCVDMFHDELRDRLEAYPELLGFLRWHPLH